MFTGNYREDLAVAKKLGIIKGNPKKEMLYNAIQQYENNNISEWQKVSESDLADELIALCDTESDTSDRPVSLLPKPVLKSDRVQKPKPVLKNDRPSLPKPVLKYDRNLAIAPNPLKRPTVKPVLKQNRVAGPKPKLNKFNRSLFQ